MASLNLPINFSSLPIVLKVEQRFGLPGFARLIKLLELLSSSPDHALGVIELPASDWRDALQVGPLELNVFLTYVAADGFLSVEQSPEPGAPLRITLADPGGFVPASQLPKVANEWCQWLAAELSMPAHHGKDPYNQSLFRHWCATNVTIDEMNAAIELAMKAGAGLTPPNLHNFLKTVRKEKLEVARR